LAVVDVASQNVRLADAVSGLLEQSPNLIVEPCTDGSVGVIVRPRDLKAFESS
jgi:hypothetical protein